MKGQVVSKIVNIAIVIVFEIFVFLFCIMMKEIDQYPGNYITDNGVVIGKRFSKPLSIHKNKDGYLRVCLYKNGNHNFFRVHRLVAEAFIDNPMEYDVVHHVNSKRDDNRVENLDWVDQKTNIHKILWTRCICPECGTAFTPALIASESY